MQLMSSSFGHLTRIPEEFAFGVPDAAQHLRLGRNRNPHLFWSGVPTGTKSLVLLCVDTDVPTRAHDVNQEGRVVPASLPRTDFYHWVMVDIPVTIHELAAGACSDGIVPRGKQSPAGPAGARQGLNDYTLWFAGDADMAGQYLGYEGPCPPWNDELVHRYHFNVYVLDLPRVNVSGAFTGTDVMKAITKHIIDQAAIVGTYHIYPHARPHAKPAAE